MIKNKLLKRNIKLLTLGWVNINQYTLSSAVIQTIFAGCVYKGEEKTRISFLSWFFNWLGLRRLIFAHRETKTYAAGRIRTGGWYRTSGNFHFELSIHITWAFSSSLPTFTSSPRFYFLFRSHSICD